MGSMGTNDSLSASSFLLVYFCSSWTGVSRICVGVCYHLVWICDYHSKLASPRLACVLFPDRVYPWLLYLSFGSGCFRFAVPPRLFCVASQFGGVLLDLVVRCVSWVSVDCGATQSPSTMHIPHYPFFLKHLLDYMCFITADLFACAFSIGQCFISPPVHRLEFVLSRLPAGNGMQSRLSARISEYCDESILSEDRRRTVQMLVRDVPVALYHRFPDTDGRFEIMAYERNVITVGPEVERLLSPQLGIGTRILSAES
eukprot:ANDGO_01813.mRNA.1 hypothetical protein